MSRVPSSEALLDPGTMSPERHDIGMASLGILTLSRLQDRQAGANDGNGPVQIMLTVV